jgi:hypothetical protein
MQLRAPTRMRSVLALQLPAQRLGHRCLVAGIMARFATQYADGVLSFPSGEVEPSLDGGTAEAHWRAGDRMAPFPFGQFGNLGTQGAVRRRVGQKMADDREAQARPKVVGLRLSSICHAGPTSLSGAGRPYEGRRPTTMGILCGPAASIKNSASTLLR